MVLQDSIPVLSGAGSTAAVWAVFLALTVLHIYANVRAVRALEVRTLNAARLEGLLAHYAAKARSTSTVATPAILMLKHACNDSNCSERLCARCNEQRDWPTIAQMH